MFSQKIQRAIERAERNLSPVQVDSDHYVVGAFDLGGDTLGLMSTTSKQVASQTIEHFKTLSNVHTVVVERPGARARRLILSSTLIRTSSDSSSFMEDGARRN